jgi:hypothetical protein
MDDRYLETHWLPVETTAALGPPSLTRTTITVLMIISQSPTPS